MTKKTLQWMTICTIFFFFMACIKSVTHVSPKELPLILKAKKTIVETLEGNKYILLKTYWDKDKIHGRTKEGKNHAISFSQIKSIKTVGYKTSILPLYGVVALTTALLLHGAATAPPPPPVECCPFIYSHNGNNYTFDAEPYGGAICRGLQRTEWLVLENLKERKGFCKILVANELKSTPYIDEFKLIAVDHPRGIRVLPDLSGNIYTISNPYQPLKAEDKTGKNLIPLIEKNDWRFWQSSPLLIALDSEINLHEELIFEFPKPKDKKTVKLIFNGGNTLWASHTLRRYLELYGNKLNNWYKKMENKKGKAYQEWSKLMLREEFSKLKVLVKTQKGWQIKTILKGGGPLITNSRVYILDISDVTSETLKIKLIPPRHFWVINHIAVDYSEAQPVTIHTLDIDSVKGNIRDEIKDKLMSADENYLVLRMNSKPVELVFKSPPIQKQGNRSFILRASGFYKIDVQNTSQPLLQILDLIHNQPGFVTHLAYQEYLNWRKNNTKTVQ